MMHINLLLSHLVVKKGLHLALMTMKTAEGERNEETSPPSSSTS